MTVGPGLACAALAALSIACTTGAHHKSLPSRERVIVDSDGAVFWDDAAAVAMLLAHPDKVEILGITTVIGNHWPYQAAEYLARVLKAAHRTEIPIYIGADRPLRNSRERLAQLEQQSQDAAFWKGAYSRPHEVHEAKDVEPAPGDQLTGIAPRPKPAVDFIVDTLATSSQPVTFVAIGPLTNLALALERNPALAKKIRRLLVMGGTLRVAGNTTPHAELNFLIDPDAAQLVLSSAIPEKLLFPLDLSVQAIITKERYAELANGNSPYCAFLRADRGPKFEADSNYSVPSWDTVVSAFLIDPGYVTASETLSLNVVRDFGPRYGSVQTSDGHSNDVKVMTKMNVARFFSILESSLFR